MYKRCIMYVQWHPHQAQVHLHRRLQGGPLPRQVQGVRLPRSAPLGGPRPLLASVYSPHRQHQLLVELFPSCTHCMFEYNTAASPL